MATSFLGLRTTIYHVEDIEEAKQWYARILDIQPYFDEPFYVGFSVGGYELGLQPEEHPTKQKAISTLTYWGVDDIAATYQHLLNEGATEHEAPHEVGGGIQVASVKDPWGNLFGMIDNPHFSLSQA